MTGKRRVPLLICAFCALLCSGGVLPLAAQETEEAVRVRTRVVFIDALVRDRRTGTSITGLTKENFEVLADGKPRPLSYFTRERDARRPLALIVVLDLRRDGAGRFLRRTEILEAMVAELSKLPPEDEVAVMVLEAGGLDENREWLVRFSRDRAQLAAALAVVPTLVAEGSHGEGTTPEPTAPTPPENRPSATKSETESKESADKDEAEGEFETKIVAKDGSVVTRTVTSDGKIRSKRVSKGGSVTVEIDEPLDLAGATFEAARVLSRERPNSQGAMIWVSDGIAPVFYAEREVAEEVLIRSNLIFSALVADMKTGYKLFMPVLKPLGNWVGLSIYGSAQHLAKASGGEAVRVRRPDDYARGLGRIIGNLTSSYSLGFTLSEEEQDDGRMHTLEVRVKARDERGKERKLGVNSRRGYYMPKGIDRAAQ